MIFYLFDTLGEVGSDFMLLSDLRGSFYSDSCVVSADVEAFILTVMVVLVMDMFDFQNKSLLKPVLCASVLTSVQYFFSQKVT